MTRERLRGIIMKSCKAPPGLPRERECERGFLPQGTRRIFTKGTKKSGERAIGVT